MRLYGGHRIKPRRRLTAALVALCLAVGLCGAFAGRTLSVRAAVSEASIKAKETEIANAKKEREQMKSSLSNLQTIKKNLEAQRSDLNSYIAEIDAALTEMQTNIEDLEAQIEAKEQRIAETEEELSEAIATQTAQYEAMKKRIRFMYERGDALTWELLTQAGSFTEMLNKAEYIYELSAYDRMKLEEYIAYTQYVELTKQVLEEEKATLDEARESLLAEQENMRQLLAEKNAELTRVQADIANQEQSIRQYEAEIAAENATIAALEKAVAAERAALAEQNRRKYDGGMFTWPCPSYTRISDNYGMRMHPTLHVEKMHNGIDLAAPSGSAVLAAYSGKVVAAAYEASMGNYIMIDHGSGLYTLYMHCSKLYVSSGTEVAKGAKIAAVGATGRATGPHLHFGVRLNGAYVSPWNYLK